MKDKKSKKFKLEYWQVMAIFLICYDILSIHAAYFIALWLRFDFVFSRIPLEYYEPYCRFITWYSLGCVAVFWLFRMYRGMWSLAGVNEVLQVMEASVLTSIMHVILITVLLCRMPISYYVIGTVFQFGLLILVRLLPRFMSYERGKSWHTNETADRVMLIGAGAAGQMLLRDMQLNRDTNDKIVCVIDDNPNKWNRDIDGVPIVGGREDILTAVGRYHVNKIFFAIPSATTEQKRDILNICNETGCELKQLPGLYQFVLGQISVSSMKDVSVEDLLGREPIQADMKEVFQFVHGKSVLVTGGGGSIGSELCRQIAAHGPRQLIILDIYENNAYDIQLELREKYPDMDLKVLIGSVRDSGRMLSLFEEYRPELVYHAAAHKHVPLMEESPCEAIKNNPLGTFKTAYAAMLYGCERFVLISTDKAVNPTNIMGASKRLCEMIVQSMDAKIKAGKAREIPQMFMPYKEVLEIMENGLRVPDDVTIVWCDDNYGNMTRLSDAAQQARSGGAGVYYHLSYAGRPHDNLWLSTAQPGLIYHEMMEAYRHNVRKLWVANVHDPKVATYDLEFFLDLAWDVDSVQPETVPDHLERWLVREFGQAAAAKAAPAMQEYYRLCAMRHPEFFGWSQVELSDTQRYPGGLSKPVNTEFSFSEFGDEAQRYIDRFRAVRRAVEDATALVPARSRDAWFAAVR